MNLIYDLFPFWVEPSSYFCEIEVGQLFKDFNHTYRLLYRDAIKCRIVRWTWFTKLFWGGNIVNGSKVTN